MVLCLVLWMIQWESSKPAAVNMYEEESIKYLFPIVRQVSQNVISIQRKILSVLDCNPLTPELNSPAQRCPTRFVTGDFAS
jgi:hypothetical protein